ncbi:hypothetical protein ACI3PL_29215, partial [Lacticaseibacillus paracasei]
CNALIRDDKGWWPRSLHEQALSYCIAQQIGQIDMNSAALVVGSERASRMTITSLVKYGFSLINITDLSEEKGNALVEDMK